MDPYLRLAPQEDQPSAPCPPDHVARPAGIWRGSQMEVVHDPRRHDILFMRGHTKPELGSGLQQAGWEQTDVDGLSEMWVRDRAVAAQASLTHVSTDVPDQAIAR